MWEKCKIIIQKTAGETLGNEINSKEERKMGKTKENGKKIQKKKKREYMERELRSWKI